MVFIQMTTDQMEFIDIKDVRIGHYIYVDLGWMSHPFPVNSFKIHSPDQIVTLRTLGLARLRYSPEKSDPAPKPGAAPAAPVEIVSPPEQIRRLRRQLLDAQQQSLQICERQFSEASKGYRKTAEFVHSQPELAREASQAVVDGMVGSLMGQQESCIRLLSEKMGERGAHHGVNVTVLSLLLGKSLGISGEELAAIGMGALLHDIGKLDLPDRLRYTSSFENQAEQHLYREHVAYGLALAKKMTLPPAALLVIAQHHEFADGSGYPQRVGNERMSVASRIVSLVNRYDNLCNPGNPSLAITPHEALAQIYAQSKTKFDPTVLAAFIRMMGVYPPGSVVQLNDERYAIVVSVNATRPLKPRLVVFDENVLRDEALVFDLGAQANLSIRRSLRPLQLPRAAIDYLAPRERICYYFEHAREIEPQPEIRPGGQGGTA
jgi:putative nucleotidyltransferase with HDIG domain